MTPFASKSNLAVRPSPSEVQRLASPTDADLPTIAREESGSRNENDLHSDAFCTAPRSHAPATVRLEGDARREGGRQGVSYNARHCSRVSRVGEKSSSSTRYLEALGTHKTTLNHGSKCASAAPTVKRTTEPS